MIEDDDFNSDDQFHDLEFQINEEPYDNDPSMGTKPIPRNEAGELIGPDESSEQSAGGILQNIQNIVSMLGGSTTEEKEQLKQLETMKEEMKQQQNQLRTDIDSLISNNMLKKDFEEEGRNIEAVARQKALLERLADPSQTKKSFEMKLLTDDPDDEVFIVHEEGEEENDDDQNLYFMDNTG